VDGGALESRMVGLVSEKQHELKRFRETDVFELGRGRHGGELWRRSRARRRRPYADPCDVTRERMFARSGARHSRTVNRSAAGSEQDWGKRAPWPA
jgi:hypothetical protein